jgi:hypothetical protein
LYTILVNVEAIVLAANLHICTTKKGNGKQLAAFKGIAVFPAEVYLCTGVVG